MENQTQSPSSSPSSARSSPLKGVTPKLFRASTWNGSKREVNDGKASANQDPNFRPNGELESKSLPNVLESEPRSVCKLYKASGIFSSKCECGEQKKHPCHSVSHTCKYCASSFTALANSSVPCKVHRGIPVKMSTSSNANQTFSTFAWSCCPDKQHTCSSDYMFREKKIAHSGYHH